jgi:hypothetical protein
MCIPRTSILTYITTCLGIINDDLLNMMRSIIESIEPKDFFDTSYLTMFGLSDKTCITISNALSKYTTKGDIAQLTLDVNQLAIDELLLLQQYVQILSSSMDRRLVVNGALQDSNFPAMADSGAVSLGTSGHWVSNKSTKGLVAMTSKKRLDDFPHLPSTSVPAPSHRSVPKPMKDTNNAWGGTSSTEGVEGEASKSDAGSKGGKKKRGRQQTVLLSIGR